ncbi:MAG: class I SAM-dependent methyltransferase [Chitinophagales bacterium]
MNPKDQIKCFDKQANLYGRIRKKRKYIDHQWRRQLLHAARGKTLEVSVGAGANFRFYPRLEEITAVDLSPVMLEKAREAAMDAGLNVHLILSTVEDLNFEPGSFDTIVSTFSLCGYDDPEMILNLFGNWCKKDGQILMLEHGASKWLPILWLQNLFDPLQFRRIGCHANRRILEIVSRSDLQILKQERKFFGAIYLISAMPTQYKW